LRAISSLERLPTSRGSFTAGPSALLAAWLISHWQSQHTTSSGLCQGFALIFKDEYAATVTMPTLA
jgi:hypothetical protein